MCKKVTSSGTSSAAAQLQVQQRLSGKPGDRSGSKLGAGRNRPGFMFCGMLKICSMTISKKRLNTRDRCLRHIGLNPFCAAAQPVIYLWKGEYNKWITKKRKRVTSVTQ